MAAFIGRLPSAALRDEAGVVVEREKQINRTGWAAIGSDATSPPIRGPARSAMIVAAIRKAAATAMCSRARIKASSGDIPGRACRSPRCTGPSGHSLRAELHLDRRAALDRLIDHAIALGELQQLVELVLRRVGVEVEAQADCAKPTGASLATPSVPRKSRSPSAETCRT